MTTKQKLKNHFKKLGKIILAIITIGLSELIKLILKKLKVK